MYGCTIGYIASAIGSVLVAFVKNEDINATICGKRCKEEHSAAARCYRNRWTTIPTTMPTQINLGNQAGKTMITRHGTGWIGHTVMTLRY